MIQTPGLKWSSQVLKLQVCASVSNYISGVIYLIFILFTYYLKQGLSRQPKPVM